MSPATTRKDNRNLSKCIYVPAYRHLIEALRGARISQHMRQQDVGRQLGVSRHWIQKVEACQLRLDLVQFIRLCRIYHVDAGRRFSLLAEELPDEGDSSFLSYQSKACA